MPDWIWTVIGLGIYVYALSLMRGRAKNVYSKTTKALVIVVAAACAGAGVFRYASQPFFVIAIQLAAAFAVASMFADAFKARSQRPK
jgi:hypothetical membrane protein